MFIPIFTHVSPIPAFLIDANLVIPKYACRYDTIFTIAAQGALCWP